MQRLTNHAARAQGIPQFVENSTRVENSLTQKLERTRADVRRAITDVQASEGRFLDGRGYNSARYSTPRATFRN
jgi:hypothetical protein